MLRKSLVVRIALFFSMALIGVSTSNGRGVSLQPLATPSPAQADCSDAAIRTKVIEALKLKFDKRKRAENFRFDVVSESKVVTLKGYVFGPRLRTSVLNNVKQILKKMGCGATLNPEHDKPGQGMASRRDPSKPKDEKFFNGKGEGCPPGQEECFDGNCKERGTCPVNPLLG